MRPKTTALGLAAALCAAPAAMAATTPAATMPASTMGTPTMGNSNMGGSNTGGSNMGGSNMGGSTMGGSNMGGSTMGGSTMGSQGWRPYFRAHSLGFPMIFRAYHPGPAWVVRHAKVLHLTTAQLNTEQRLTMDMAQAASSSVATLRTKYADYQRDAAMPEPSLAQIDADIDAIGQAQAAVGRAMIPSHLKAYQALDHRQQAEFRMMTQGGQAKM